MKRKKNIDPAQLELALACEPEVGDTRETMAQVMPSPPPDMPDVAPPDHEVSSREPCLWRDAGWTARVIRNEHDEGWAVEMTKDGEAGPTLVGPWTMGRDKKNPKPLDAAAFASLVKSASELRRRHEQQLHAMLHKSVTVATGSAAVTVTLDIVPDEDDAYATLAAFDEAGAQLAQARVAPTFKLSKASAAAWIASGFQRPERH